MAFPKSEQEMNVLLQIWKLKLSAYAAKFGLLPAQLTQVSDDADFLQHLLMAVRSLQDDVDEVYAYKTNAIDGKIGITLGDYPDVSLPPLPALTNPPVAGIYYRNKDLYNYLKNHPNRNDEALADLGISETPAVKIPADELKSTLEGKPLADDKVEIGFNKQNQTAIRVRGRIAGEDWSWEFDATSSPVIDERPSANGKPEKREYQGVYLKSNKPYGQYSDIITVITNP